MRNSTLDITRGPLFKQIMIFALPVMVSNILQLLFNSADLIVVGNFAGSDCIAAVGSTGSLVSLLVTTFIGLSVGTAVLTAQYLGAGDKDSVHKIVHTSIVLAVFLGLVVGVVGFFFSGTFLKLMKTPDDIIDLSTLYLKIYFLGVPGSMMYNFGAAIMRSNGDTRRPLYYLSFAGVINVLLNLIFVALFHMNVDGVAWATVISQYISCGLVIASLRRIEGPCRLIVSKIKAYPDYLWKIIKIGLPAGLQGSLYSISNVLIQSSINIFGTAVLSGNTAGVNIENYVNVAQSAFHQSALVFAGQNKGAENYKRAKNSMWVSLLCMTMFSLSMSALTIIFRYQLLGLFINDDPEALYYGAIRFFYIGLFEYFCGFHDVICGELRGLGHSAGPMILCFVGICGTRILWIYTYFQAHKDIFTLWICYPISWILTSIGAMIYFLIVAKHLPNTDKNTQEGAVVDA